MADKKKAAVFDVVTGKRVLAATKYVESYTDVGTAASSQFKGGSGGGARIARAKLDPEDTFPYPTFSDWSDGTEVATVYSFELCTSDYDDTSNTGARTLTGLNAYVWVYSNYKHYIPLGTQTTIYKVNGKYYTDYQLPATMMATLSADLNSGSSANCTLTSVSYSGATITGTVKCYDPWSIGKITSGTKVMLAVHGTKLEVVEAGTCPT